MTSPAVSVTYCCCRYERIFQVATWGHCSLLLGFILRELLPGTIGSVLKITRLAAGLRPTSHDLIGVDGDTPFMDALASGTMRVRCPAHQSCDR